MTQTRQWSVYSLIDPRDDVVRYVGLTTNPTKRLRQHLYAATHGAPTHLYKWIRTLIAAGLKPTMRILEADEWTRSQADLRERYWISEFRRADLSLTNYTRGGEGGWGSTAVFGTREYRDRVSAGVKARFAKYPKTPSERGMDEAWRDAVRQGNRRAWDNPVKRDQMLERFRASYSATIAAMTEEERQARHERHVMAGKSITPEGRERWKRQMFTKTSCPDCGREFNRVWMKRHKTIGQCT